MAFVYDTGGSDAFIPDVWVAMVRSVVTPKIRLQITIMRQDGRQKMWQSISWNIHGNGKYEIFYLMIPEPVPHLDPTKMIPMIQ